MFVAAEHQIDLGKSLDERLILQKGEMRQRHDRIDFCL